MSFSFEFYSKNPPTCALNSKTEGGGVGFVASGCHFFRSIKQVLFAFACGFFKILQNPPKRLSLDKTSASGIRKTFGATHVMASALGCLQTLRIEWFERHSRPAVFARRKPHFERHRLLRHDEHSVFLNAVSFRSMILIHSAQVNA